MLGDEAAKLVNGVSQRKRNPHSQVRWNEMQQRKRRAAARANGLCIDCLEKPLETKNHCSDCNSRKLERQREKLDVFRMGNICRICRQQAQRGALCAEHRKVTSAYNHRLYLTRKQGAA